MCGLGFIYICLYFLLFLLLTFSSSATLKLFDN